MAPACDFNDGLDAAFYLTAATDGSTQYVCLGHFLEFALDVMRTVESGMTQEQQAQAESFQQTVRKRGGGGRRPRSVRPAAMAVGEQHHHEETLAPPEEEAERDE